MTAPTKSREQLARLLEPEVVAELSRGVPGFDRAGLLASLIQAWGGLDQVAQSLYSEFNKAAPGSMIRQRILDLVCRMLSQHSNDPHVQPVEEMNETELRHAILSVTEDFGGVPGVGVRGVPKKAD